MASEGCALLESPTGTGKTLALLGASLAYQQKCDAEWKAAGFSPPPAPAIKSLTSQDAPSSRRAPPRVVWIARTHEQLQHAIAELRRLPYRPLESLRISRERFCLHPFVQQTEDRNSACEMATMTRHGNALGGGITGCLHLDHAEAIGYPNAPEYRVKFEQGGALAVHDIEDLVKEGVATQTCPYHASMDLTSEGAGLVFATYPQLLDPCVRMTSSFDAVFADSVIVVDEAHNLPQAAREAASFRASISHLDKLLTNVRELAAATVESEAVRLADTVSSALSRLRDWLHGVVQQGASHEPVHLKDMEGGQELRDVDGRGCVILASSVAGLQGAGDTEKMLQLLKALRRSLVEHGLEGWAVRSSAINEMDTFLRKMAMVFDEGGRGGYALVVTRPEPARGPSSASLAMVSLHAAVAFRPAVERARAVLLASGTLAPFDLMARELGMGPRAGAASSVLQQPVEILEAAQNAGLEQRLAVLSFANVAGQRLNSSLKHRQQSSKEHFAAAGRVLAALVPCIPNGSLVFLPSRAQLRDALLHWRQDGLLLRGSGSEETLGGRPVVVESDVGGDAAAAAVARYRALAAAPAGAVLLAVMRGRCAEGVDFRDELARGVVVLGVPFPALDAEVRLKREFERQYGTAWYEAEAHRAVSQVAGRLLRHRNDYGCLLLLDERFARREPPAQLSRWLRDALRRSGGQGSSLEDSAQGLRTFFAARARGV